MRMKGIRKRIDREAKTARNGESGEGAAKHTHATVTYRA